MPQGFGTEAPSGQESVKLMWEERRRPEKNKNKLEDAERGIVGEVAARAWK